MRYMFRFSVGEKLGHYMVLDNDVELDHADQLYYDKLDHGKRQAASVVKDQIQY